MLVAKLDSAKKQIQSPCDYPNLSHFNSSKLAQIAQLKVAQFVSWCTACRPVVSFSCVTQHPPPLKGRQPPSDCPTQLKY